MDGRVVVPAVCCILLFLLFEEQHVVVGLEPNRHLEYERVDLAPVDTQRGPVSATPRKYSNWTRWSQCSRGKTEICQKKRFRTCIHTVEAECPHGPLQVQHRVCKKCTSGHSHKSARPALRQSVIDDLMGANSDFEDFFFGEWNRWTRCLLEECKQYRWKVCLFSSLCGEQMLVQQRACADHELSQCHEHTNEAVPETAPASRVRPANPAEVAEPEHEDPEPAGGVVAPAGACGFSQLSVAPPASGISTKIYGGRASTAGRWPWQVSILNHYLEHYCAGTLISNWVLTAAHCVRRRIYIRLGEHNTLREETSEQLLRPTKIIIHRHFNTDTIENDIALIKLPDTLKFTPAVHPICLPEPGDDAHLFDTSTTCMILGWGKRRARARFGADVLQEAEIEVTRPARCRAAYADEHPITDKMICAGSGRTLRSDTCEGDSGGPLLCRTGDATHPWKVYGITSFGDGCGKRDKYGVYTKVSAFTDWIANVVARE